MTRSNDGRPNSCAGSAVTASACASLMRFASPALLIERRAVSSIACDTSMPKQASPG
jgi:hypothetical protein